MLFIAGLSTDFDEVDLKEMFELYGEVTSPELLPTAIPAKAKALVLWTCLTMKRQKKQLLPLIMWCWVKREFL